MPKRIQRKRTKGWKMPPNCVYVGRPTIFGNPFQADDPEYAVAAFRLYANCSVLETEFGFIGPHRANIDGSLPMAVQIGVTRSHGKNNGRDKPFLFVPTTGFETPLMMVMCPNIPGLQKAIAQLRGKDLACWCPVDQPCHADVLIELANN